MRYSHGRQHLQYSKKQNKKKPSETINTGSYYNKANRLIIIYAFGQFQTTVACISK